jgi:hypothetical protein
MRHVREMTELVDLFIAPARYLHDRYRDSFGLPERKLTYLDYGFATGPRGWPNAHEHPGRAFHVRLHRHAHPGEGDPRPDSRPSAGVEGAAKLRIWGRRRGQDTEALVSIAASLPGGMAERVEWLPEYKNQEMVRDVFDRCDAIVVPSVWVENSPLVIHEAQQARIPVITANVGGMAEYVQHEENGLLFEHRSQRPRSRSRCHASSASPSWPPASAPAATSTASRATCRTSSEHVQKVERALRTGAEAPRFGARPSARRAVAHHVRHEPGHLQPPLRHVRGALAAQPCSRSSRKEERRGRAG